MPDYILAATQSHGRDPPGLVTGKSAGLSWNRH